MSIPLDAILDNASEGSNVTCTLSPGSVQVIFFALSLLENREAWKEDYFDSVTDAEWEQITDMLELIPQEILP